MILFACYILVLNAHVSLVRVNIQEFLGYICYDRIVGLAVPLNCNRIKGHLVNRLISIHSIERDVEYNVPAADSRPKYQNLVPGKYRPLIKVSSSVSLGDI